jgi:hypothetical protein
MTTVSPHAAKSLVRAKAVLLAAIFLGCGTALKHSVAYEDTLLAIAGISAMLLWFVRCETCKSSIYYQAGGGRRLFPTYASMKFFAARRCPGCGQERL